MSKNWSEQELQFLKNNYLKLSYKKISAILGRSINGIEHKCNRLKLVKNGLPLEKDENYGKLTVLESYDNGTCLCVCRCGKKITTKKEYLKRGSAKSCGCCVQDLRRKSPGEASFNKLILQYKNNAKTRKLEYSLTRDQAINIITKSCEICGDPPSPFNPYLKTDGTRSSHSYRFYPETIDRAWVNITGIDRIDNNEGYTIENSQSCCFPCNEIKMTRTMDEMYNHIDKINNYRHKK